MRIQSLVFLLSFTLTPMLSSTAPAAAQERPNVVLGIRSITPPLAGPGPEIGDENSVQ